jgi:starch-binding outer membrane protein, SusD/RagB family
VEAWDNLQTGIIKASQAISTFSKQGNNVGAAQARLLRGFLLWQVADLYGATPWRDIDSGGDILSAPEVITRAAAIDTVISDLNKAADVLPTRAASGYPSKDATFNKEAAWGLLAKVYLNRFIYTGAATPPASDMDAVISNVDKVINSGSFSLAPGAEYFSKNFGVGNQASTESVFAIVNTQGDGGEFGSRVHMTLHYNSGPSGWNGFTTIADFYNKWDQNDKRFSAEGTPAMKEKTGVKFGFLVGQQFDKDNKPLTDRAGNPLIFTLNVAPQGNGEVEGVRVLKYEPDFAGSTQFSSVDYPFLRYADLLLCKAEALWRKGGGDAPAITIINQVRANRGVPDITVIAANGQQILDERGFELYWEGHRRTDQIRFNDFNRAWTNKGVTPATKKLFPYPQGAVDTNPNLTQNPGY